MTKQENIKQIAERLQGFGTFMIKPELKELPTILWQDELVEDMIQGEYNKRQGLLVATDKRLIFIHKGMLFGINVQDFTYQKITTIEYNTGLIDGRFRVFAAGNCEEIKSVIPKSRVREFGEFVRSKLNIKSEAPPAPVMVQSTSVAEQLERLAALKEKGILTDDEFAVQKAKILSL